MREELAMYIEAIIDAVLSFARGNPLIAGLTGLVLLVLLWKKPKLLFGLLLLSALLVVVLSFVMDAASIGSGHKKKLIERGGQVQDER